MQPGEYFLDDAAGDIRANAGRRTAAVLVRHTGDRPVQVGSHFHFFEVNRALERDHRTLKRFIVAVLPRLFPNEDLFVGFAISRALQVHRLL